MRILFTAIILVSWMFVQSSDAQSLGWNFKQGDSFQVTFDQESLVTTEFNTITRKVGTRVRLHMDWNVTDVSQDNVATIEQTLTRILVTLTSPTATAPVNITLDTDLDDADSETGKDMLKQIKPLVMAKFTVELQSNGTVNSVVASEPTMKIIRETAGSMKIRELITPEGLKQLFGQSGVVLPKSDFQKGETWNTTRPSETAMGKFSTEESYAFDGEVDFEGTPVNQISLTTATTFAEPAEGVDSELVTSKGEGKIHFATGNGLVSHSEIRNEFTFKKPYRESAINTDTVSVVTMRVTPN